MTILLTYNDTKVYKVLLATSDEYPNHQSSGTMRKRNSVDKGTKAPMNDDRTLREVA